MAEPTPITAPGPSSESTLQDTQTTVTASEPSTNTQTNESSDSTAVNPQADADIDAELKDSMNDSTAAPTDTQAAVASNIQGVSADAALPPTAIEPRLPQKKDASLRAFLPKLDDHTPLIPDAVTDYYLTVAGLPPPPETDRRLARLLALATQKFIADIAADAYQYSRIRSTNTTSNNPHAGLGGAAGFGLGGAAGGADAGGEGGKGKKGDSKNAPLGGPRAGYGGGGAGAAQGRTVLTMEDLGMAVGEYGVNVKRSEFYR